MVIDVRNVSKSTEDKLRTHIISKFGYRKKGELSKTIESAILFYLEHPDLFEKWKKEKELKIKTLKKSFDF